MLCSGLNLAAQEITGSVRSVVIDPSGAGVPAASVTVSQVDTGLEHRTVSDRQGTYTFVELPIGRYRLMVEAKGFQRYIQKGIFLNVNQTASVPIHLMVGSATQTVQVTANAALIETASTTLGKTVGGQEIVNLLSP